MKRFILLAAALVMVLGMAVSASAAPEVTISGNMLVNSVWKDNWNFSKAKGEKNFRIMERADLYFTVTANENLKGVLGLRSQRGEWGQGDWQPGSVADAKDDGAQLNIRDAYIDFNWPGTDVNVKAGIQMVALPHAVGNASMILAERAGAVFVSTPITDNVGVLVGYTRMFDNNTDNSTAASLDQSYLDGYLLALPLNFEGVKATPFFLYGNGGENFKGANYNGDGDAWTTSGEDVSAYWVGTDFTMSLFDPFILKADLNYGKLDADSKKYDASGWVFDLGLDYTGFDFMTVSTYFVYTTGSDDDSDTDGLGSMPVIQGDWAVGSFFFGNGMITGDDMDNEDGVPLGFWTVGLSLTDIQSFAEGLTHDFHVLYVKGTNDKKSSVVSDTRAADNYGHVLSEDDSLWEVDFNTAYAIYDELTLYTQLGYINSDFDKGVWGDDVDNDAWKVATGIVYQF